VESRTGNLVSTRIDTPCLHVHETFCALGVGMGAHLRTRTVFESACCTDQPVTQLGNNDRGWVVAACVVESRTE
jgi:hypothetical protein